MINFALSITNVFTSEKFKNFYCIAIPLTQNKTFEFEFLRHSNVIVGVELDTFISGRDHAGPELYVSIFGFTIHAHVYDNRHWDYQNNKWEDACQD